MRVIKINDLLINEGASMPTFNVQLFEGRTVEQKRKFGAGVTRVTGET